MSEPQRIYRLVITYPPGSDESGWLPRGWTSPVLSKKHRRQLRRQGFSWPRERLFLSRSGAVNRAGWLRSYGAAVEVIASEPVTWPQPQALDPAGIPLERVS
jgi:hypothetical protein